MHSEASFLQAIIVEPDDDAPRQLFADWLDENTGDEKHPGPGWPQAYDEKGKPIGSARAAFIRVQCMPQGMVENSPRRQTLERLRLTHHMIEWERPLTELGASNIVFRRGFPESIDISSQDLLAHADELFTRAPIRELHLSLSSPDDLAAVLALPQLAHLATLSIINEDFGYPINEQGASLLANSPHLSNLTTLELTSNHIRDEGAAALASSPYLTKLTTLQLGGNFLTADGVTALANSEHMQNLEVLNLESNHVGREGAAALAHSPHMKNLHTLNLWHTHIEDRGLSALIGDSSHLTNLKILEIGENDITHRGIQALVASSRLTRLAELNLGGNPIGDDGAELLAGAANLRNLTYLNMDDNIITNRGAAALAGSLHLSGLTTLSLIADLLDTQGARMLVAPESRLRGLTGLYLDETEIPLHEREAIRLILEARHSNAQGTGR